MTVMTDLEPCVRSCQKGHFVSSVLCIVGWNVHKHDKPFPKSLPYKFAVEGEFEATV